MFEFLNENEKDSIKEFHMFFFPLFILSLLNKGQLLYLVTIIAFKVSEKFYDKNENINSISKRKQSLMMMVFFYFFEQYILLYYSNKIYWIAYFVLLSLCFIYYFFAKFKSEIKNKGVWINFICISLFLITIGFHRYKLYWGFKNIPTNENVATVSNDIYFFTLFGLLFFLHWFLNVWLLVLSVKIFKNEIYFPVLCCKFIEFIIYSKFFEYIEELLIELNIVKIYFMKSIIIIVILIMMFLLKELYYKLKTVKINTLKEKSDYVFSIILGVCFSIEIFFTIMINYSTNIFDILL